MVEKGDAMKMKQVAWTLMVLFGLTGCAAHSPFIVTNTTDVNRIEETKYPPHSRRVYVTGSNMPANAKYEVLGILEVGKVWYGSSDNILESLADGARELGADAVVGVKTWHQPSGWSWAAPHGSGCAVKISDPADVDLAGLGGEWK